MASIMVFNNDDLIVLLAQGFDTHGMYVRSANLDFKRGRAEVELLLREQRPSVVVFHVGIPYKLNWDFMLLVRRLLARLSMPFVVTTGNKLALERVVADPAVADAYELIGSRSDLALLMGAIRTAQESTTTRR